MSSKKWGPCPRCGASYKAYQFLGRWKHCYACGYDRKMEDIVANVRYQDKHGHGVSKIRRLRVAKYQESLKPLEVQDDS